MEWGEASSVRRKSFLTATLFATNPSGSGCSLNPRYKHNISLNHAMRRHPRCEVLCGCYVHICAPIPGYGSQTWVWPGVMCIRSLFLYRPTKLWGFVGVLYSSGKRVREINDVRKCRASLSLFGRVRSVILCFYLLFFLTKTWGFIELAVAETNYYTRDCGSSIFVYFFFFLLLLFTWRKRHSRELPVADCFLRR